MKEVKTAGKNPVSGKTEIMNMRLSPNQSFFLDEVADAAGVKRSEVARAAITLLQREMTDEEGYFKDDVVRSLFKMKHDAEEDKADEAKNY